MGKNNFPLVLFDNFGLDIKTYLLAKLNCCAVILHVVEYYNNN